MKKRLLCLIFGHKLPKSENTSMIATGGAFDDVQDVHGNELFTMHVCPRCQAIHARWFNQMKDTSWRGWQGGPHDV